MGIVHGGSIAFPSTFIRTGYNQLPSQPGISSGAPIDQREVVDNKADLISATVWSANGGDTRYQGMIVHVFSEHKSYILVDVTQKASYDGWKAIGVFDKGDNYKVLMAHGTATASAYPDFQFITGNSFDNQDANVVFAGPSSGSAAKPTFRSLVGADLPTATASVKGAVTPGAVRSSAITATTGGTTENRYFGVELDSDGKMFVNVPAVTSVRVQGSDIINSSTNTASTTTLDTTISIKKAAANKVLMGNGTTSSSTEPSFQYITADSFAATNPHKVLIGANTGASTATGTPTFRLIEGSDLPVATTSTIGAIKVAAVRSSAITSTTGGTTENRYFGVELDSNNKPFVNVPAVTSVQVQGSDIINSSTNTASTTTLNTTISIKKAAQYKVLTGNGTGSSNTEPSFQFVTGNSFGTAIAANTIFGVKGSTAGTPAFTSAANLWAIEDASASGTGYLKKDSNGWSLATVSTTDTKNTAGSTNTSNKIYLVGPTSKSEGTTADPDDHQTYTNGENYIGTDGRLYTINKKVALEEDVDEINELLSLLEQWPTITHTVNSATGYSAPGATLSQPTALTSKFRAAVNGVIPQTNITSNNQAVKAGSSVTVYTAITVTDSTTFSPSSNSGTVTGTTSLAGFTNGWRTTETGDITRTPTTVTSSASGNVTYTKTDKAKTSASNLVLNFNGTDLTTVQGASGVSTITIPTSTSLTSSLPKGLNTVIVTHNCPSTCVRSAASYTIPAISRYNVSSLDRSNSTHIESEAANSSGYAGASVTATATTRSLNIYGIYPVFSTAGNILTNEQTAKDSASTATTGSTNTNSNLFYNYYTGATSVAYFMFGSIPNGSANSTAKIFLPSNTDSENNLTITEIKGYNSMSSTPWSVPMTLTGPTNVTVDGRTYKQWIVSDSNSAGQGPNAYRVTISR